MAKLLKIPVAKMGSWFHETHGVITFSGNDLRALERNFRANVRGYEPYLKTGHNEKGPGIYDDEKAEAHLVDMIREGDTLFGLFEPHGEDVVNDVLGHKYRYSSAELIRSAKDRQTGLPIDGPILRGVALTNTPSIPHLPRNSVLDSDSLAQLLSDDHVVDTLTLLMSDDHGVLMSAETPTPETQPAVDATAEPAPAGMLASIKEAITEGFKAIADTFKPAADAIDADAKAAEKSAEELAADAEAAAATVAASIQTVTEEIAKTAEQLALEAELVTLREAAAVAEAARVAAEAKTAELEAAQTAAAEKAAADAAAAEAAATQAAADQQAADEAAAATEAARKEGEFTQLLSDRVAACVGAGIPPLEAKKAQDLVLALRASTQTVMLSDKDEPTDLVDAVFELLSDRVGVIDFGQAGAVDAQAGKTQGAPANPAKSGYSLGNPWSKLARSRAS
jgi:hypothetical protein